MRVHTRRIGRRKFDRVVFGLAILGVLAVLAYLGACDETSPTKPSTTTTTTSTTTSTATTSTEPTPAPEATPTPKPDRPVNAICTGPNDNGMVCTFETDRLRPVNAVCTPPGIVWAPNSPSDWGSWSGTTDDSVSPLDICNKFPNLKDCSPVSQKVQIDFHGAGRHAGHAGPTLTFPQKLDPKECEQCEEGGPYEGPVVYDETILEGPCELAVNNDVPRCHQNGTQTLNWDCQDPTEVPVCKNVPCECQEGGPYGPTDVGDPDWSGVIEEGFCPNQPDADLRCHEMGKQATETTYDCKDPEPGSRDVCRPARCPLTCDDFEPPPVSVDFSIVTQEADLGLMAAGFNCNAIHNVPGLVVCSVPPSTIAPPLPQLVPWSTSQLFTFSWSGFFHPTDNLECPISGQETDLVEAPDPPHGTCFYNVAQVPGGQEACFAEPGFISWNEQNHLCELEFPGVDRHLWNLNPGQSDPDCLKHHGGPD